MCKNLMIMCTKQRRCEPAQPDTRAPLERAKQATIASAGFLR